MDLVSTVASWLTVLGVAAEHPYLALAAAAAGSAIALARMGMVAAFSLNVGQSELRLAASVNRRGPRLESPKEGVDRVPRDPP